MPTAKPTAKLVKAETTPVINIIIISCLPLILNAILPSSSPAKSSIAPNTAKGNAFDMLSMELARKNPRKTSIIPSIINAPPVLAPYKY